MNISSMATATVFVLATVMLSAGMLVCMMAAAYFRIIIQVSAYETAYRFICIPAYAAEQLNSGGCKCCLGSAADTAANQGIHAPLHQEASQRAVAAAVGVHHFLPDDLAVRHFIELELLRVAEVLENLTVFIGNCDFHIRFSFLFVIGFVECLHPAAAAAVRMLLTAADAVIPAGDA